MTAIGFLILGIVTTKTMSSKITDAMVEEFVNVDTQIAKQVSILLEKGATVDERQMAKTGPPASVATRNTYP